MKLGHLTVGLTAIAFVAAASFFGTRDASAAEPSIRASRISLRTASGPLRAEVFEQTPAQRRPVLIVLHGAGGTLFDGPEMRRVARHLAAAGNAVYLLHYFERTGTLFARDAAMQKHFGVWKGAVLEAIPAIQQLRADPAPVGIYGYSLGGFLALFSASDNPRVGAVVEHAGGVWNGKMDRIGKLPPVLMIHGERDRRVLFDKYARPLETELRKRGVKIETQFYPDEQHVFTQPAMGKVREAAAAFFRRHLPRGGVRPRERN
jgi:dienelactone hydrolase